MGLVNKVELPRKVCPVIFLLDTSGSMDGQPIGALNYAMESILPELESMNKSNPDAEIRVAALTFQTDEKGSAVVTWVTGDSGLQATEGYKWTGVEARYGTPMGAAFVELERVLHVESGFMNSASGSVAPVLFLLSDGQPTDDYQSGLEKLQENNWYNVAARVAIGYGQSNDDILEEFTKNPDTVKHTNNVEDLKELIQFVTITSSMVASNGRKSTSEGDEEDSDDTTSAVAAALRNAPPKLAPTDENW